MRTLGLLLLAAVALLTVQLSSGQAPPMVDDIDPLAPPAGFWDGKPIYKCPSVDGPGDGSGIFRLLRTQRAYVNQNLIADHAKDFSGTKRNHAHYKDDCRTVAADVYWNKRFGESDNPKKTNLRVSCVLHLKLAAFLPKKS